MYRIVAGFLLGITGVAISNGTHTHIVREDIAVDFPSIANLTTEIVTVSFPGAEVGDAVVCNASESLGLTVMLGTCTVLTPDTVSIKAGNFKSTGAVDPPSQVMHIAVFKEGN